MKTTHTSQKEEFKQWVCEMLRVYRGGSTSTRRAALRTRLRDDIRLDEANQMPGDAPSNPEKMPDRRSVLPARDHSPLPSQRHGNFFMAIIIIAWLLVVILYFASVPKSP